jgi:hypothetical protein
MNNHVCSQLFSFTFSDLCNLNEYTSISFRYVKLSLVCPLAENEYGKQFKQTAVHGASTQVMYDPPQFFGFVCEPNLNKAKLILTVMDKVV